MFPESHPVCWYIVDLWIRRWGESDNRAHMFLFRIFHRFCKPQNRHILPMNSYLYRTGCLFCRPSLLLEHKPGFGWHGKFGTNSPHRLCVHCLYNGYRSNIRHNRLFLHIVALLDNLWRCRKYIGCLGCIFWWGLLYFGNVHPSSTTHICLCFVLVSIDPGIVHNLGWKPQLLHHNRRPQRTIFLPIQTTSETRKPLVICSSSILQQ